MSDPHRSCETAINGIAPHRLHFASGTSEEAWQAALELRWSPPLQGPRAAG